MTQTLSPSMMKDAARRDQPWWRTAFGTFKEPTALSGTLVLGLLCAIVYSNSFEAGFALDNRIILSDTRLQEFSWQNLHDIFGRNYWWPKWESDLYRPLTTLSYLVNYSLGASEKNLAPFHAVNLLLHWANAALVLAIARRIMGGVWPAVFTAAIFAVHPLATESVTSIVGRADLFATFFVLLGLWLHVRIRTGEGNRWVALGLLMVGSIIGVFCKESAIVIIGPIVLYDLCFSVSADPLRRPRLVDWGAWWQSVRSGGWMSYAAVGPSIVLLLAARYGLLYNSPVFAQTGCDNPVAATDDLTRAATAIGVIGDYFMLLVWPANLSADYSYNQIPVFGGFTGQARDTWTIAWMVIVPALLAWVLWRGRWDRNLLFFAGVFCGTFVMVSNIFFPIGTILGERLMYLPSVGFIGAVVVVVLPWARTLAQRLGVPQHRATAVMAATACVMIAGLGVRAFVRNFDWYNNITLWTSAMKAAPNSHKVYSGLASALWERDGNQTDFPEMIRLLDKAVLILDGSPKPLPPIHLPGKVYDDLATTCIFHGDKLAIAAGFTPPSPNVAGQPWYARAYAASQRAIQVDAAVNEASRMHRMRRGAKLEDIPDVGNYTLHLTRAEVLLRLGMNQEALDALNYARRLEPSRMDTHARYAVALAHVGQAEQSAIILLQCLILDGTNKEVWQAVATTYQRVDPRQQQPAVLMKGGSPLLNSDHPLIQRHLAMAIADLVQLMIQARRPADAEYLVDIAATKFGHNREMYAPLLKKK